MITRLSGLLEKEYHAHVLNKALNRMEDDHRNITNYACQQLQSTEDSKLCMEQDATKCLRLMEIQIQQMKLEYIESCQQLLRQRQQYLQKVHERKMEKIHELEIKEHMVVIRPTCKMSDSTDSVNNNNVTTSSKWLEEMLDENYFPSSPTVTVPDTTAATTTTTDSSDGENDHQQQQQQTTRHHHRPSNSNSISDWVVCGY